MVRRLVAGRGKIAYISDRGGNFDVYVVNEDGSGRRRLTRSPAVDGDPRWSPDGRTVAFLSDRDSHLEVYVVNADGSGEG